MTSGPSNVILNSYKGPAAGKDYEAWREVACRAFCGLDIQPLATDTIDCRLQISLVGNIALAMPSGNSAQFSRTTETISDGCDDLVLVTAGWGSVPLIQEGREIGLIGSQMCLTDMAVHGTVGHGPEAEFTTTRISRQALLAVAPRAEDMLATKISDDAALRETVACYQMLCADMAPKLDSVGQQLMAQHLVELIGLLVGGSKHLVADPQQSRAAATLDLMRAAAMRRLGDPSVNIASLARQHGLSERQAQRLFERAGGTFTAFLVEQRLQLARRLLLNPQHLHRKISDIAHRAGFSDLSYFNRAFRGRFRAAPSEIRAMGPRQDH
jgi:AraC-like DNA-binding protein